MNNKKIILVDDHVLLRQGLAGLLNVLGYTILYECDNGRDLLNKFDKQNLPDIVLMDIHMPEMDGFEATLWLTKNFPSVHVLALTMLDNEVAIIRMLRNGAKGYIKKDTNPMESKAAIESVLRTGFHYSEVADSCTLAKKDEYGAPLEGAFEPFGEMAGIEAQQSGSLFIPNVFMGLAFNEIQNLFHKAADNYSDIWLSKAARVIFMSYFIELPDLEDAGMEMVWKGLNTVTNHLKNSTDFMVAAPMEFRFVKGGNAALAGTYSDKENSNFVNLDLIAFVKPTAAADYSPALLKFFADIEREWVAMGGITHNGKMFGFYDPGAPNGSFSAPFNPAFLKELVKRRNLQNGRVDAFEAYRRNQDPDNLFCNDYVRAMLG